MLDNPNLIPVQNNALIHTIVAAPLQNCSKDLRHLPHQHHLRNENIH